MKFSRLSIVIRPSGVWNSRAPLHNYIHERRALSKTTCLLTLAIYALRHDARSEQDPDRSGRQFLARITKEEAVAAVAWLDYRRSFPKGLDGKNPQPSVGQIAADAILALYDIREMTIVRLSSLFEAYAQCWAMNYLVAVLEAGKSWSSKESELAQSFHPVHGGGHLPSWPQITKAIPMLKEGLQQIPHRFNHPTTGVLLSSPTSTELNAFTVIQFWRAFRNLSIHTSRLVTRRFFDRYDAFFARMMADLSHLDRLEPGKLMPLHDDMFSAMAAVQYRAALWMNEKLVEMSKQRRGHPEAPHPVTTTRFDPNTAAPPLFVEGDHAASFRWTVEPAFREQLSSQEGWELPNPTLKRDRAKARSPLAPC